MTLYDYQIKLQAEILQNLRSGSRATLAVLPTGGGKTVVSASITAQFDKPTCTIAHRQELVGQLSLAQARAGIYHRIVAPEGVVRFIIQQHIEETGRSYNRHNAWNVVTGVDTIIRRTGQLASWMQSVALWQIDEGHHVRADNKWGKAVECFPNAQGVAWTATPMRADGKSLKAGSGGCYDALVQGPTMRELITRGRLSDFRIFGPEESVDLTDVHETSTGDFNQNELRNAVHKAPKLVGDTVSHYLKLAPGLLGITFVVDIESAREMVAGYQQAGIPAMIITANTPVQDRARLMGAFKRREYLQLVNVDICGEGTDLPAVEVISMARPSASFNVVMQQFGRVIRVSPGKEYGIVIDHAGNIARMAKKYGLPDDDFQWSLDLPPRKQKTSSNDRLKTCLACRSLFFSHLRICPICGTPVIIQGRSKPEQCDGDLTEYTPELLAMMRKQAQKIMEPIPDGRTPRDRAISNSWNDRIQAQMKLREAIAWFGGFVEYRGLSESEGYRLFWQEFAVDVLGAQALGSRQANELTEKIHAYLRKSA